MPNELRNEEHEERQKHGFMPLSMLLSAPAIQSLIATNEDIRRIVRGAGGNRKLRSQIGTMRGQAAVSIRASHGQSASGGVSDDFLPVAEDLVTAAHGTSLVAARSIAQSGISKSGGLHVHFYEGDLEGRPEIAHLI